MPNFEVQASPSLKTNVICGAIIGKNKTHKENKYAIKKHRKKKKK
jgi:hypothetical protein